MAELEDVQSEKTKKQLYDENKQKKLALQRKQQKKEMKKAYKEAQKKKYKNPVYTTPGKILIWILSISMVATLVASLIYMLIKVFRG